MGNDYMNRLTNDEATELYDDIRNNCSFESNRDTLYVKTLMLRPILEKMFYYLTRYATKIYFFNNSERMEYIFNHDNVDADVLKNAKILRNFLNRFHHFNETNGKSSNSGNDCLTNEDYWLCIKTLCNVVNYFSKVEMPADLEELYKDVQNLKWNLKPEEPKEKIDYIRLLINTKDTNHSVLRCSDIYGNEKLLYFKNKKDSRYFNVLNIAWECSTIYCYNIEKLADKPWYTDSQNSMIILEPDYLVDATAIAKCFENNKPNPMLYLVEKFSNDNEIKENMILGSIANTLLDEIIVKKAQGFNNCYMKAMSDYCLDIFCLFKDNDEYNNTLKKLHDTAKEHYNNILQYFKDYEKDSIYHIEPYLISPQYGLQGRLDLLVQRSSNKNYNDIFELKSGSAPNIDAWPEHRVQVYCYHLLVESCYNNRAGNDYVFYSKLQQPAHDIQINKAIVNDIMMVRNHIVSYEYQLATGNFDIVAFANEFQKYFSLNQDTMKKFKKAGYKNFISTITKLQPLEIAYINNFIRFIATEHLIAKTGNGNDHGFSSLWCSTQKEKADNFLLLTDLEYDSDRSSIKNNIVVFKRGTLFTHTTVFREGDICIVYPDIPAKDDYCAYVKHFYYRATILELNNEYVKVRLRNNIKETRELKTFKWCIEKDLIENNYTKLYKSLFEFMESNKRDILLGLKEPEFHNHGNNILHPDSDEDINEIIALALNASDYFCIQGPPGTGKTRVVLKGIVNNLHRSTDENIMLLACTNRAVDEICLALQKSDLPYIRLGKSSDDSIESLDTLKNRINNEEDLKNVYDRIINQRVFVSTVSTAQQNRIFNLKKFTTVIVDEASQLLEPDIVGLLTKFKRFILIGDEKQLPPVVTQDENLTKVGNPDLEKICLYDLSMSLFERLILNAKNNKWHKAYRTLKNQKRMHNDIAEFPNKHFYEGALATVKDDSAPYIVTFSKNSYNNYEKILANNRLVFIESKNESGSKKENTCEAAIVVDLIKLIINTYTGKFKSDTVGVITPFRAQINCIKKKLLDSGVDDAYLSNIMIDTVERFQGSERDIIIVSLAVNSNNYLESITSFNFNKSVDRKLNVTLTRGKEHVVIIGCSKILQQHEHYSLLIEHIKNKGGYANYENLCEPLLFHQ